MRWLQGIAAGICAGIAILATVYGLKVWKNGLISALALILSAGAFVPLWRRAARSFSVVRLSILVVITAAAFLSALALAFVILSAGVIRG